MQTEIPFPYTLKRSARSRRLRFLVSIEGELTVTAPQSMPLVMIERLIGEKSDWITRTVVRMKKDSAMAIVVPQIKLEDVKEDALRFVRERVEIQNAQFGFSYRTIKVRDQKRQWGSCSKTGNLNFNYRIIGLPSHLADYIILHELCHLKEFNHSKAFWDLMVSVMPDAQERRKMLKRVRMR